MARTSDKKKKIRIVSLMILSQLVLSIFVGYWLVTQYEKEKEELTHKLYDTYYDAHHQVTNMLMYESVIKPILDQSENIGILPIEFDDFSLPEKEKTVMVQSIINLLNDNEESLDEILGYYKSNNPLREYEESIQIVVRNLSSFIYQAGIRFHKYQTKEKYLYIPFAYNRVFNLFNQQLKSQGFSFDFQWLISQKPEEEKCAINLDVFHNNSRKYIIITGYNFYLLKVITPQIIFVLIMLSLTASALTISYRSLVKQMKLNTLRNEFINNITHELKIPVATAKVALEALRNFGLKADPKVREEYLEMVSQEMNRLDNLTARVLEHSKLEKHEKMLKKTTSELCVFVRNIVDKMKVQCDVQNITINFSDCAHAINIEFDQLYLEGVIKNLLDNSIKYGGSGTTIDIAIKHEKEFAYITLQDDGPGIPKEYLSKVFDKFFRVPTHDRHNVKGFGLGLSFAALVMREHGGEIMAKNLPEKGCKFTLKLPVTSITTKE
ncbi:HAMP domain-containing histidine kinase [Puteibacter caeruleilacunae]|nr:HAMP domain-containing histidine kinase [Puteibacter caeruleilacunae]